MVATLSSPQAGFTSQSEIKTYEDYAQLPEGAPFQLIEGALLEMTSPTPLHQIVLNRLLNPLTNYVWNNKLGEVLCAPMDVYLSEINTPQPDIIFIATENSGIIGEKKIEGAPDLVIEILSPSTAYLDLKRKKQIYEKFGVKEYWIVDPIQENIEVFVNEDERFQLFSRAAKGENLRSKLLSEFPLEVQAVFA